MNIQAVARRTGVPAATLRKWEERYGVPAPERTGGAQRRYGERELRQIEWLRDRLTEGVRIGQAAAMLRRFEEPLGNAEDLREAILDSLRQRRPSRMEALVHQAFEGYPIETTVNAIVVPVLHAAGEMWEEEVLSVADEHFVSQLMATKLRGLVDSTSSGAAGIAVLACIPGELHEIGLLCLAALLQNDGWRVLYLGQDTPLPDAFELASEERARVLAVSATMAGPVQTAAGDLTTLEAEHPDLRVERGGTAFDGPSADRWVKALRRLRRTGPRP